MRAGDPEVVACPDCGAGAGETCRMTFGKPRAPHVRRRKAAEREWRREAIRPGSVWRLVERGGAVRVVSVLAVVDRSGAPREVELRDEGTGQRLPRRYPAALRAPARFDAQAREFELPLAPPPPAAGHACADSRGEPEGDPEERR